MNLKCELIDINAYKLQAVVNERAVVDGHGCYTALHFCVKPKETNTRFLRYTGYLNSIKNIEQYLVLLLALV